MPGLSVCAERGCHKLTKGNRCEEHQTNARQMHRRFQTGPTAYNSARWVRFSQAFRASHPFCVNAEKGVPGCTLVTEVTDHVTPHEGNEEAFWSGPFQPMCRACHSVKTAREVGFHGCQGGELSSK